MLLHDGEALDVAQLILVEAGMLDHDAELLFDGRDIWLVLRSMDGCEEPGVSEDGAAEHDAVGAGLPSLVPAVGDREDVAVAEDEGLSFVPASFIEKFVPYLDCVLHVLPSRRHLGHLLAGAGMDGDDGRLRFEKRRKPCLELILAVSDAGLYGYGEMNESRIVSRLCARDEQGIVAEFRLREAHGSFSCCLDDLLRSLRILDHRRSASLLLDALVRAAHIDIDAVEAELGDKLRRLLHVFGIGAEELGYDGALADDGSVLSGNVVYEVAHELGLAFGRSADDAVCCYELSPCHIGLSACIDDLPECAVRDIGHGGEHEQRPAFGLRFFAYSFPESQMSHMNGPYPTLPGSYLQTYVYMTL